MKLTTSLLFDYGLVAGEKSYEELQPLFQWLQSLAVSLGQISQSNVSLSDNLDAEKKQISIQSNVPLTVSFRKSPQILLPGQLSRSSSDTTLPLLAGFNYTQTGDSSVAITARFTDLSGNTLSGNRNLTIVALF